jgi:hypothetical protein
MYFKVNNYDNSVRSSMEREVAKEKKHLGDVWFMKSKIKMS